MTVDSQKSMGPEIVENYRDFEPPAISENHWPAAIETVTPMLDKDGKWRVSGYYIKPAQR